jgi:hypothetical protein
MAVIIVAKHHNKMNIFEVYKNKKNEKIKV